MNISSNLNRFIYIALSLLIISCIFDPTDRILHLKLPLFGACWVLMILEVLITGRRITLPWGVVIYLCLILSIPLLSIVYYMLFVGNTPYEGFQFLKSYLFVTIIVVLYISNIDIIKQIFITLAALSCLIIIIFIITYNNPVMLYSIGSLGEDYGCLRTFRSQYGPLVMNRIFYTTSPMIAISIPYYIFLAISQAGKRKWFILLSLINIFAMLLSGTRANIVMAIFLPLLLIFLYVKQKKIIMTGIIIVLLFGIAFVGDIGKAMFNPSETSIAMKISKMRDYKNLFNEPSNLIFGQGVGSYYYWTILGVATPISELTYFEVFRNYGLIGGAVLLMLLLYPLIHMKLKSDGLNTSILIGYGGYLVISSSNPLLFSSSGMLLLSAVIGRLFLTKT